MSTANLGKNEVKVFLRILNSIVLKKNTLRSIQHTVLKHFAFCVWQAFRQHTCTVNGCRGSMCGHEEALMGQGDVQGN